MARIATFYSYKGGTGRSMALANVAWILASRGLKVLVVDWDLEAPGLHRYFRPFLSDKELTRPESQGVIDLVGDFAERLAAQPGGDKPPPNWYLPYADITKWKQRLSWPSGLDATTTAGGFIDFVPAGRQGPQYAKKVNSFDWARFYERYDLGGFLDAVRRSMDRYDWVLIDSRTGVSDTSGICTVQFPDVLVACFTLNLQSVDGTSAVAASAKAARKKRPLRILPVAMRLDFNEEKLLNAMFRYAQSVFTPLLDQQINAEEYWQRVGVPYFPRYAYSEKLAPFEDQINLATSTLPAVERFVSYLTDAEVARLEPLPEGERRAALEEFERLPQDLAEPIVLSPVSRDGPMARIGRVLQRARYRYLHGRWVESARWGIPLLMATGLGLYLWLSQTPTAPLSIVRTIIADARQELLANRREHAALLIAEAANRLGSNVVVASDAEPGGQLHSAFQALLPLSLWITDQTDAPWMVVFSRDGHHAAITSPQRPTQLFRFPPAKLSDGINVGYSTAAFDPDSRFVAASERNRSVGVFDVSTARRVWRWDKNPESDSMVTAVTFSPDGSFLAFGTSTGRVYTVRTDSWKEWTGWAQQRQILTLAVSPDSRYVASSDAQEGLVMLWSPRQPPNPVERLRTQKPVRTIAFAPSSNPIQFATADGAGRIEIWTQMPYPSQPRVAQLEVGRDVDAIAFSPDGTLLAIADTASVRLVQMENGQPGSSQVLAAPGVQALAFSTDGNLLATAGRDNIARIWQFSGLSELQRLSLPAPATSVALTADGRFLGVGTNRGVQWSPVAATNQSFSSTDIQAFACSQVRESSLSADEWKRYFGSEPVRYTCQSAIASVK